MRVDGDKKASLAFDNMMGREIKKTTEWAKYEVVLDIPKEADAIYFGFLVAGKGQGWVDDIQLEVVGDDVKSTDLKIDPHDLDGNPPEGLPETARAEGRATSSALEPGVEVAHQGLGMRRAPTRVAFEGLEADLLQVPDLSSPPGLDAGA
jgi:hypothetical protein